MPTEMWHKFAAAAGKTLLSAQELELLLVSELAWQLHISPATLLYPIQQADSRRGTMIGPRGLHEIPCCVCKQLPGQNKGGLQHMQWLNQALFSVLTAQCSRQEALAGGVAQQDMLCLTGGRCPRPRRDCSRP